MLSLKFLWNKHKRKVFFAFGAIGGAYVVYKLYNAHRSRTSELEIQLERAREVDELIKSQLQNHFQNIQKISDTVTLPYAVHYLRTRIAEDLDLSDLTDKLRQPKGQCSTLTPREKSDLWERLKVLSFTRLTTSLWSMTMLCLYVRVLVNILGRHLYVDIARGSETCQTQEDVEYFSTCFQKDFLSTADYLSTYGINTLIMNMQIAAKEVLNDKQLKELFGMEKLHEVIMQILQLFMSIDSPNDWINYLIPENATKYMQLMAFSFSGFEDSSALMEATKLEQLMLEMRAVLSSPEFGNIIESSLDKVVDVLVEEVSMQFKGSSWWAGAVPLVTLLPRVAQLAPSLLEEPSSNKFIPIIQGLPQVEVFYTLLYSNMPAMS